MKKKNILSILGSLNIVAIGTIAISCSNNNESYIKIDNHNDNYDANIDHTNKPSITPSIKPNHPQNNKIIEPSNNFINPEKDSNSNQSLPNSNSNSDSNSNQSVEPNFDHYKINNEIETNLKITNSTYSFLDNDRNYIDNSSKEFKEINQSEDSIRKMILNDFLPKNFYSHPRYKIKNENSVIGNEQKGKLSLVDTTTQTEVVDGVSWYQRLRYPETAVIKGGEDNSNTKLKLDADGSITGKQHDSYDSGATEVWAYYKGHLYSTIVDVMSVENTKKFNEEKKAREEAKKIVKDWHNLPILEKITETYKWITKNVKYDHNRELQNVLLNQTAYSALVEKHTVCTGYAKGFKMLMDELGIQCRLIEGQSSRENAARHVWNLIEVDGEWYHVDPTSDRLENRVGEKPMTETEFKFFMNSNEDFDKKDKFNRSIGKEGSRLRNYKINDFVHTKDEVLALIDNKLGELNKIPTHLTLVASSFSGVIKAFEEKGLEISERPKILENGVTKKIEYEFINKNKEIPVIDADIYLEKYKTENSFAIKVKFNNKEQITDLKVGNFNIENAMIKEVKKIDDGYILFLDHFKKFGDLEITLKSIKKMGYKFNIKSDSKLKFKIEKHSKPNATLQAISSNQVVLKNVSSGMQYKKNNNEWFDITNDNFLINNATLGTISIRYKDTYKVDSEVQTINLEKAQDVDNQVKLIYNNLIIGLDDSMEYRLKDEKDWKPIANSVMSNPKKGTYLIRRKAFGTTLASQTSELEIQ
ncbi:MAG6410 family transglutaminase-related lipoprotein [Metamycoplasma auris]|uniref:Transglutaminase superfamily protein n=1 Tax=Metamycoplasma auris TaxID=51363 RepID=A0A2W7G699_9BACT|nr:transglutaminase domain-containing protein [Metamycoplasma auris]PZW00595.1 transglutaminase superfamily protein [Metamycoplasma auris]